ncbi:DEAD/DEAH box helicase [Isoalcanivorax beigongshangi]|uniref:ATP-dependent RNA helicase DeaD n=1 Tax=Isoalcanivorax beigongshangi TaxID=3238810 RepID=A0ABV4AI90_9GAMM
MSDTNSIEQPGFDGLGLSADVLRAVAELGYQTPSAIQQQIIPHILASRDVIGQAQTGTGKTAAFALPLISRFADAPAHNVQVLVMAPTRELALQVTESFETYSRFTPQLKVIALCGGMDYRPQTRALKDGVQVVVGTPGRIVDHLKRGTLSLAALQCIVLDEADEMLRMGFIDDVEWVLEQAREGCQVALLSATMPPPIRRLAQRFLSEPEEVTVAAKTATVAAIRQRYLFVNHRDKLDALVRVLETETFDGVILFARTKESTVELADFLQQAGFRATALNGDMAQPHREQVVEQLKAGRVDILVATDVVARGLDVPRITMVLNYDIPFDGETYVHRIGRTGRAGREGDAILFVTPREKRMLFNIERLTRQKVEEMPLPTAAQINAVRKARFKARIGDTLAQGGLDSFATLVNEFIAEHEADPAAVAAALAKLLQGDQSLEVEDRPFVPARAREDRDSRGRDGERNSRRRDDDRGERAARPRKAPTAPDAGMTRYRIEVGRNHGAKPANIVGAIANEANLNSNRIGRIDIFPHFSTVDLPEGMTESSLRHLRQVWVAGQQLNISVDNGQGGAGNHAAAPKSRPMKQQRTANRDNPPRRRAAS